MLKRPMVEILPTIGAPRNRVENWLLPDRLQLTTRFEQTERGHTRLFSRVNTLELALIAAFVKAGAPASGAAAMAAAVLREDKNSLPDVREWWVFAAGDTSKGKQTNDLDLAELQPRMEGAWPPVLTVVRVGEIVRRVDKLFEAD